MKPTTITLSLAWLLLIISPASAQDQLNCSSNPELAQLDFWIGQWRVEDEFGEVLGSNNVFRLLNGCLIQERWQGVSGGIGISLFYVSPDDGKLKQVWVSGQALSPGGTKEKTVVAAEPGQWIQFQGSYPDAGETIIDRTTLSRESDGRILQIIEISRDNGQSWESAFRGLYWPR